MTRLLKIIGYFMTTVVALIILVILWDVYGIYVHDIFQSPVIGRSFLNNKLPANQPIKVSEANPNLHGIICRLGIYQTHVNNIDKSLTDDVKSKVDAYIKSEHIIPMEGEWVLIDIAEDQQVNYTTYRYYSNAGGTDDTTENLKREDINDFTPIDCAPVSKALIIKTASPRDPRFFGVLGIQNDR